MRWDEQSKSGDGVGGGRKLFGKYLKALGFPFSNGLIPLQLPCRGWKAQLCFSNTCLASYKCLGTWWVFTTPWCAVLGACRPRFRGIRGAGEEHAVGFAFLYLFLNWDFFSPSQLELKKLSSISFPVPPPMVFFVLCYYGLTVIVSNTKIYLEQANRPILRT